MKLIAEFRSCTSLAKTARFNPRFSSHSCGSHRGWYRTLTLKAFWSEITPALPFSSKIADSNSNGGHQQSFYSHLNIKAHLHNSKRESICSHSERSNAETKAVSSDESQKLPYPWKYSHEKLGRSSSCTEASNLRNIESLTKIPGLISCLRNLGREPNIGNEKWVDALTLATAFEKLLLKCEKQKAVKAAEKLFNHSKELKIPLTLKSYLSLHSVYLQRRQKSGVVSVFQSMSSYGMKPTKRMCASALTLMKEEGDFQRGLIILNVLEKADFRLNPFHYGLVLSALSKSGKWQDSTDLLSRMTKKGITPNEYCYSATIASCRKGGKSALALKLLREMELAGLRPNVYAYNATLSVCAKAGNWRHALDLLSQMNELGLDCDSYTYSSVIASLRGSGQWEKALGLIESMKARSIPINLITYSAAISVCANASKFEPGMRLFNEMLCEGVCPDSTVYDAAILLCSSCGEWKKALELMETMEDRRLKITRITYNNLLLALNKGGRWDLSLRIFPDINRKKVKLDTAFYNTLLMSCQLGAQFDTADDILSIMNKGRIELDVITYSIAIGLFESDQQYDKCFDLISAGFRQGVFRGVIKTTKSGVETLDLHRCSLPLARALVRYHLQNGKYVGMTALESPQSRCVSNMCDGAKKRTLERGDTKSGKRMWIITGKGSHVLADGTCGKLRNSIATFVQEELKLSVEFPEEHNLGRMLVHKEPLSN